MIGQSIINIKSGGRGRLSAASAGAFLLIMVVGLGDLVSIIPMPALVAITIMVPIGTFSLVVRSPLCARLPAHLQRFRVAE